MSGQSKTLYHERALSNTDNESSLSFYVETARTVSLYVMIEGRQKFADREIESLKEHVGSVGNLFSKLPPALASGLKLYWKFLALAKSHAFNECYAVRGGNEEVPENN
ncbi:MAG TPA: hypothetical protein VF779_03900 [Pyrinomonadaceae bacterium]